MSEPTTPVDVMSNVSSVYEAPIDSAGPTSSRAAAGASRNAVVDVTPCMKIFDRLAREFGRANSVRLASCGESRIGQQHESLAVPPMTESEKRHLSSLSAGELAGMLESDQLRRKHCERRIESLQKRLLQAEERLAVFETLAGAQDVGLTDLKAEVESLYKRFGSIETDRLTEIDRLDRNNSELNKNLAKLEREYEAARANLNNKTEQVQKLQNQLDKASGDLAVHAENRSDLEAKVSSLRDSNSNLNEKLRALETEKIRWTSKEKTLYKDVCEFENYIKTMKVENDVLKKSLQDAELDKEQAAAFAEAAKRQAVSEAVANCKTNLKSEFETKCAQVESEWERIMQEKNEAYASLKQELERTRHKVVQLEAMKSSLQQALTAKVQGILHAKCGEMIEAVSQTGRQGAGKENAGAAAGDRTRKEQPSNQMSSDSGSVSTRKLLQSNVNAKDVKESEENPGRREELRKFVSKVLQGQRTSSDSGFPQ